MFCPLQQHSLFFTQASVNRQWVFPVGAVTEVQLLCSPSTTIDSKKHMQNNSVLNWYTDYFMLFQFCVLAGLETVFVHLVILHSLPPPVESAAQEGERAFWHRSPLVLLVPQDSSVF